MSTRSDDDRRANPVAPPRDWGLTIVNTIGVSICAGLVIWMFAWSWLHASPAQRWAHAPTELLLTALLLSNAANLLGIKQPILAGFLSAAWLVVGGMACVLGLLHSTGWELQLYRVMTAVVAAAALVWGFRALRSMRRA